MKKLEELAVKFIENEDYNLKIKKAGVFRFLEEYSFREHSHEEYEINYISSGQAIMRIEGEKIIVPQGQCVVIPPNKRHSFWVVSKSGCKITQLEMSVEMKSQEEEFFMKAGEMHNYYVLKNCEEIIPILERIARLYRHDESDYNAFLLKISTVEMMITLNHYINQENSHYSLRATAGIKEAIAYIQEHFSEPIDFDKVANASGISSRYMRKYFSDVLGMTCMQFITGLRIEKAKHLLWETNQSILTIALETGYDNAPYFSRVFRKAEGMTPRRYRMLWKSES